MKRLYKIAFLLFLIPTFSSCLKDEGIIGPDAPGYISNIVEFYNETPPTSGTTAPYVMYVPKTLEQVEETEFTATISYSGAENAPQDILVNLSVAPEIVEEYNTSTGGQYVQASENVYEFPQSVTIKKGQKRAQFTVKVKPLEFDQSVSNVVAIAITSASHGTVSGNFGKVIFSLPIKSIWEGTYDVTVINDYNGIDANIGGTSTGAKTLSTVGPNRLRSDGGSGLWFTYSGYTEYQFNGDNTDITGIVVYSGSVLASNIDEVVLVDAENRIFEINYTGLGRGIRERWVRTGD